jgi:hypothetical protein
MTKWLASNKELIQSIMWGFWLIGGVMVTLVMSNIDNRYIRFDEAAERMKGMWVPAGQFNRYKEQLAAHLASDALHSENEISRHEFESYKNTTESRVGRLEELMIRVDDKLDRLIEMQLKEITDR